MPVLVTGGAGYIGSHMVLELIDAGEEVLVLDDLSTGFAWAVSGENVSLVRGDVGDAGLLRHLISRHGIDAILHFAAKSVVPESVTRPLDYYRDNTVKSRTLIEAAVEGGVRDFIFSSTASVYGDAGPGTLSEDLPVAPINPYGRTKVATEWMLEDARVAHGLRYGVLRYFNVAGADPKGRAGQSSARVSHIVKAAVQAALGLRPYLEIFGDDYDTPDGTSIRDYVQVNDVARAHLAALGHLRAGGESLILNCGYGRGTSVKEVVDAVKGISGVDFEVRSGPRRGGDPARLVARIELLRQLGWRPLHDDLGEIVSQALRWERTLVERNAASEGLSTAC